MPQVVQKQSFGSVTVFWLNREAAVGAARTAAQNLAQADTNVLKIVLFGSLASGTATATSDADILLVLKECREPLLDRAGLYAHHFADVELPVELFVYTEDEIAAGFSTIAANAISTGIDILT